VFLGGGGGGGEGHRKDKFFSYKIDLRSAILLGKRPCQNFKATIHPLIYLIN